MKTHFTCISYDRLDFLVPSSYIISGIYLSVEKESHAITFNRETLPHIYIGQMLQEEFVCKDTNNCCAVLVFDSKYFAQDIQKAIVDRTETALPASGNVAISMTGSINSHEFDTDELRLMPYGIRLRMTECGICAVRFTDNGRKQLLISPDSLLRRFFAGGK